MDRGSDRAEIVNKTKSRTAVSKGRPARPPTVRLRIASNR